MEPLMPRLATELKYQFRYALPLWLVSVFIDWWPDNRITLRVRGLLVSLILKNCGKTSPSGATSLFSPPIS